MKHYIQEVLRQTFPEASICLTQEEWIHRHQDGNENEKLSCSISLMKDQKVMLSVQSYTWEGAFRELMIEYKGE